MSEAGPFSRIRHSLPQPVWMERLAAPTVVGEGPAVAVVGAAVVNAKRQASVRLQCFSCGGGGGAPSF